MKKELLLTAMITAGITTTAFAASNLDISATTAAPLSMQNSIAYGGDNKVEQGMFSPVKNILLGGDKNTVRPSANDTITSGSNNISSAPGSIVAGWYNTNSATILPGPDAVLLLPEVIVSLAEDRTVFLSPPSNILFTGENILFSTLLFPP